MLLPMTSPCWRIIMISTLYYIFLLFFFLLSFLFIFFLILIPMMISNRYFNRRMMISNKYFNRRCTVWFFLYYLCFTFSNKYLFFHCCGSQLAIIIIVIFFWLMIFLFNFTGLGHDSSYRKRRRRIFGRIRHLSSSRWAQTDEKSYISLCFYCLLIIYIDFSF